MFVGLLALVMAATVVGSLEAHPIALAVHGIASLLAGGFGAWLLAMGAQLTVARAEIDIRGFRVRKVERVGPVMWWRSADTRRLRAIEVGDRHMVEGCHGIDLRLDDGRTLTLAPGYPEALVTPLAAVLRERHRWLVAAPRPAAPLPRAAPFRPVTEIRFIDDAQEAHAGECQVCGRTMSGDVVSCAQCRTPHHRDCWDYNRKCSTFACGSKRFVKGVRPRVEEVVEIRGPDRGNGAGLGKALAALARELGGQMLRHPSRKHRRMRFKRLGGQCTLEAWRTRKGFMVELEVEMPRGRREQAGRLLPAERDWLQYRDLGHALLLVPARRLRRTEDVLDFVRRSVVAVDGVL